MADDWFVKFGSDVHGPMTSAQLRMLARKGVIKPGLPVRRGQSKWVAASQVRGLFGPSTNERTTELRKPATPPPEAAKPAPEPIAPTTPDAAPEPPPVLWQSLGFVPDDAPAASRETEAEAEEGLALPIDLHLEAESLRDDRPTRIEPEPVRPEEAEEPGSPAARRRPFLGYEGTVRSIGLLFYANAFLTLGVAVAWALRILRRLDAMGPTSDLRGFYLEVLGTGAALLAVIGAGFVLGGGLRALKEWSRWATATLMVEMLVGSAVAEMMLAIVSSAEALKAALVVMFVGLMVPGYVLFVVLGREGDAVFSPGYRDWVTRTPGLKTKRNWAVALVLLVEWVVVGFALYLAWR